MLNQAGWGFREHKGPSYMYTQSNHRTSLTLSGEFQVNGRYHADTIHFLPPSCGSAGGEPTQLFKSPVSRPVICIALLYQSSREQRAEEATGAFVPSLTGIRGGFSLCRSASRRLREQDLLCTLQRSAVRPKPKGRWALLGCPRSRLEHRTHPLLQ